MNQGKVSPNLSLWLDACRGLAALAVLFGHLRYVLFADAKAIDLPSKILFTISGHGHDAVLVFFAMSGFLVGGSFLQKFLDGNADVGAYAIARVSRLYTVLVPALLLTFLLDAITLGAGGQPLIAGNAFFAGRLDLWPFLAPDVAACNAIFMQTLWCPEYGTNLSLWSLSNEAIYYLIWPALLMMRRKLWAVALVAVICLTIAASGERSISYAVYFAIWCWGAVCYALSRKRGVVLSFTLAAAFLGLNALFGQLLLRDCALASAFVGGVLALSAFRPPLPEKPVRKLADMSFSLYSVHLPILVLLLTALGVKQPIVADSHGIAYYLLVLVVTFAVAAAFYFAFERRTNDVRGYLMALVKRRKQPVSTIV